MIYTFFRKCVRDTLYAFSLMTNIFLSRSLPLFLTLFEPESRCGDTVVSHLNLKHGHFHLFSKTFLSRETSCVKTIVSKSNGHLPTMQGRNLPVTSRLPTGVLLLCKVGIALWVQFWQRYDLGVFLDAWGLLSYQQSYEAPRGQHRSDLSPCIDMNDLHFGPSLGCVGRQKRSFKKNLP